MDWSKYSALKSGSKASMSEGVKKEAVKYVKDDDMPEDKKVGDVKEAEVKAIYLSQKRWDADSGDAMDDAKMELSLPALEAEKARYDADMARAKAQSDGLKAVIADFKKI